MPCSRPEKFRADLRCIPCRLQAWGLTNHHFEQTNPICNSDAWWRIGRRTFWPIWNFYSIYEIFHGGCSRALPFFAVPGRAVYVTWQQELLSTNTSLGCSLTLVPKSSFWIKSGRKILTDADTKVTISLRSSGLEKQAFSI